MEAVPEVGAHSPINTFNRLVLPQPFFPSTANLARGYKLNSTLSNSGSGECVEGVRVRGVRVRGLGELGGLVKC